MKELLNKFKWLIVFSIISPFFLYLIVITPCPIPLLGIIKPEDSGAWLGYYGAILGGFMTLSGVWWTIKEQKDDLKNQQDRLDQQRREDLAIQYKPILEIKERLNSTEGMYYRDLVFSKLYTTNLNDQNSLNNEEPEYVKLNSSSDYDLKFIFALQNIGRGCIANSYIKKLSIENPEYFDNHLQDWITNTSLANLVPNQKAAIVLHLPGLLRIKNELLEQTDVLTNIRCIIEYTDEFDIHKYEYHILFTLKVEIRNTDYNSGVENVSIIAPIYYITQIMPVLTQIK